MSLSDSEIRKAARKGEFRVSPSLSTMNPAGFDLRVDRHLIITPHKQALVASLERVELSPNLVGILHIRSSLAREGLFASLALVDPGFRGQLTISLYNAGDRPVKLKRGERFIQLSLFRLGKPAEKTYNGRYQGSTGVVRSRRRKKSYTGRMESIIQRSTA